MATGYQKLTLIVLIAASTVVRLWTVSERSFWHDEAFSWSLAREASWTEMLHRTAGDVHPPLSYVLIRMWSYICGTSEVGLRLFSIFLAVTTLWGCYLFCRDLFNDPSAEANEHHEDGQWIGISTMALIGSCSIHIKWSQEARMYTLGTTLVFFSTWMLLRAMRASGLDCGKWWYGYSLTAIALAYTHNFGLFSIAGQGFWCIGQMLHWSFIRNDSHERNLRTTWLGATAAFLTVAISYLPWASVLFAQTRQAELQYWTPQMEAWTIPECFGQLLFPTNSDTTDHSVAAIATTVIAFVAAGLLWRARSADWLLLSLMLVPIAFATWISLTSVQVFIPRYFLFAYMFVLCAVPRLSSLWLPPDMRSGLIGFIVLNSLIVHALYWASLDTAHRQGMRAAVAYLSEERRIGEIVVVADLTIYFSARYYLIGSESPRLFVQKGDRAEPYCWGGSAVATEWMINGDELKNANIERIWIVGTPSRGLSQTLSECWQAATDTTKSFSDTYFFLRDITVTAYDRHGSIALPLPAVN